MAQKPSKGDHGNEGKIQNPNFSLELIFLLSLLLYIDVQNISFIGIKSERASIHKCKLSDCFYSLGQFNSGFPVGVSVCVGDLIQVWTNHKC